MLISEIYFLGLNSRNLITQLGVGEIRDIFMCQLKARVGVEIIWRYMKAEVFYFNTNMTRVKKGESLQS